ncbi:MAG: hypothetical protein AABW48_02945 [Nanoarchaeota archaeon]
MGIIRPEDKGQVNIKRIYPATINLSSKQREDLKKDIMTKGISLGWGMELVLFTAS